MGYSSRFQNLPIGRAEVKKQRGDLGVLIVKYENIRERHDIDKEEI
jgi:hypothetical protein